MEIGRLRATPKTRQEFIDCHLETVDPNAPLVMLDRSEKTANPFIGLFRHCGDVIPEDFHFGNSISSDMERTSIIIGTRGGQNLGDHRREREAGRHGFRLSRRRPTAHDC